MPAASVTPLPLNCIFFGHGVQTASAATKSTKHAQCVSSLASQMKVNHARSSILLDAGIDVPSVNTQDWASAPANLVRKHHQPQQICGRRAI